MAMWPRIPPYEEHSVRSKQATYAKKKALVTCGMDARQVRFRGHAQGRHGVSSSPPGSVQRESVLLRPVAHSADNVFGTSLVEWRSCSPFGMSVMEHSHGVPTVQKGCVTEYT